SAGTFQLGFNNSVTAPISATLTSTAMAAAVQDELDALPTVGRNNAVVTAPTATTVAIAFQNALGGAPLPLMSLTPAGLTGGPLPVSSTTPGATTVTVTPGGTLTRDNTGSNSADRLNDEASIALNGGSLNFLANNTAGTASGEVLGPLVIGAGASTFQT